MEFHVISDDPLCVVVVKDGKGMLLNAVQHYEHKSAFREACKLGNLSALQCMHTYLSPMYLDDMDYAECIQEAAENEHFHVTRWLLAVHAFRHNAHNACVLMLECNASYYYRWRGLFWLCAMLSAEQFWSLHENFPKLECLIRTLNKELKPHRERFMAVIAPELVSRRRNLAL